MEAQRKMENLGHGLVAVKINNGVYLSWRITGQEWRGTSYNIYRDGVKITPTPITGASNYLDITGNLSSSYTITSVHDGIENNPEEKATSVLPKPSINIRLKDIPKIEGVPDTYYALYSINDVVAGDLDGDGEYELIVKRINEGYNPLKPFENKYYTLFDAYKLDGTFLWRINIGPNLFHNVELNAFVFDLDGDGKAEVIMRTSEGTIDGKGNILEDLGNAEGEPQPDGITNYRDLMQNNGQWFEYKGPEYLSLFNGQTGEMMDRIDHIARQPVSQWGPAGTQPGGLAHRACKYHYAAPYLDGKKPSLLVTRGIYYRTKMETYDIVHKKFVKRWSWDSGTGSYCGQGNHNMSIADVDDDGRDEIIYGSMTIDDNGQELYSTGLGHGDAIHVGDFDPYRKGLEVFACLEDSPNWGSTLRKAENGEILYQYIYGNDLGRCMAANISNEYYGAEIWPTAGGVYSSSERRYIPLPDGYSTNFRIFWDGDLLDELVDHIFNSTEGKGVGIVQKLMGGSWQNLLQTIGYYSCNYTKGTPCLQADILGDWREELIYRNGDESEISIFMTTIPTDYRIYTLMHDMQYRQAIAWQMGGYNQPPHPSFFLGEKEGITVPPPPVMDNQKLVFKPGSTVWGQGSTNWIKDDAPASYEDNKDLLFDVTGHATGIQLSGLVTPRTMTLNSPDDYSMDMSNGTLGGTMTLIKQGSGTFSFNGKHSYSGNTEIWDGLVCFSGTLSNSPVWINRFAQLSSNGNLGKGLLMEYGSVLYPGGKDMVDSLLISAGNVEWKKKASIVFDLGNNFKSDKVILKEGTLKIENGVEFELNSLVGAVPEGDYVLAIAPHLEGIPDSVLLRGMADKVKILSYKDGKLILTIKGTRPSASIVWTGSNTGAVWNFASDDNFSLDGDKTIFVAGDQVIFDDTALSKTVNLSGSLTPASITVNNISDAYTIQGDGVITGTASLLKKGTAKLTLKGKHDFTGAVVVKDGILALESLPYLSNNSSIGQKSDNPDLFVLDGGVLTTTTAATSERALKIGSGGGTISTNSNITWNAPIVGTTMYKSGSFNLNLGAVNNLDTLKIKGGTVILTAENVVPARNIVLTNGVLQCYDNSYTYSTATWNLVVDGKGTVSLDSRCDYNGKLSGAGELTLKSPFVRSYLNGDWSAFTGKIIATTSAKSADLSFNNNYGLPYAELAVNGALNVFNNKSKAFSLGALSGTTAGSLTGSIVWTIGNKNINTAFNGTITNGAIVKVGTGTLTLTGANTYTGGTTINEGKLLVANSTESALGSGEVIVNTSGTLAGSGSIRGKVKVTSGGIIQPGNHSSPSTSDWIATLMFAQGLTLNAGATIDLDVSNDLSSDLLVVEGTFVVDGVLNINSVSTNLALPVGSKLQLFDLSKANVIGSFSTLKLPQTNDGTHWDISNLLKDGTIEVVANSSGIIQEQATKISVIPNPASNYIVVSDRLLEGKHCQISFYKLNGRLSLTTESSVGQKIDIAKLPSGSYLLKILLNNKLYISKLIKQ